MNLNMWSYIYRESIETTCSTIRITDIVMTRWWWSATSALNFCSSFWPIFWRNILINAIAYTCQCRVPGRPCLKAADKPMHATLRSHQKDGNVTSKFWMSMLKRWASITLFSGIWLFAIFDIKNTNFTFYKSTLTILFL